MNYKIYNIAYDAGQFPNCEFDIYHNTVKTLEEKSYLFEYNPILNIMEKEKEADYIGIFSWKFAMKTGFFKKKIDLMLNKYPNQDVYSFCQTYPHFGPNFYEFTEKYHPGFMEIFKLLCDDLGLDSREGKNLIYSNFVLVKWEVYKDFIETVIKPAITLLEDKYEHLAWRNANYVDGLNPQSLKIATGLDYYPMHTFVLERLWIAYLQTKKQLKCTNLTKIIL